MFECRALVVRFLVAIRAIGDELTVNESRSALVDFWRVEKLAGDWIDNATDYRHDISGA